MQNYSSQPDSSLTLEGMLEAIKNLPDSRHILAYFEVPDQEMAEWLFAKLRQHVPAHHAYCGVPEIRYNRFLGPNTFLARNNRDEPLRIFIRQSDTALLCLNLEHNESFEKTHSYIQRYLPRLQAGSREVVEAQSQSEASSLDPTAGER